MLCVFIRHECYSLNEALSNFKDGGGGISSLPVAVRYLTSALKGFFVFSAADEGFQVVVEAESGEASPRKPESPVVPPASASSVHNYSLPPEYDTTTVTTATIS